MNALTGLIGAAETPPGPPPCANTATSMNNLANLLLEKGDYAGAEPLYRRALEIREKALGADNPYTERSLNSLAYLLELKGDYAGAEELYGRSLTVLERAAGPDEMSHSKAPYSGHQICRRFGTDAPTFTFRRRRPVW